MARPPWRMSVNARVVQIEYLARRLVDRAEGHPLYLESKEHARFALRGHVTRLVDLGDAEEDETPRELTDEQIEEIRRRADRLVTARTQRMQVFALFVYLLIPVLLFAYKVPLPVEHLPWLVDAGLDEVPQGAQVWSFIVLFFTVWLSPLIALAWTKVGEWRARVTLRFTPGTYRVADLPTSWLPAFDECSLSAVVRWIASPKVVHVFTASFLVALVAFLIALVNTDYHIEHYAAELARDGGNFEDYSSSQRLFKWFDKGKTEIALAGLLTLIAFLLENVMENLSVTREGLKTTAEQAKAASDQADKIRGVLQDAADAAESQSTVSRFMALLNGGKDLQREAQDLARTAKADTPRLHHARALDLVGRRLDALGATFRDFFGELQKVMQSKLSDSRGSERDVENVYHLAVMATAFDAAFNAQQHEFIDNGADIVAPFEALGGFVARLVESILEREDDGTLSPPDHKLRIEFYTLLPIAPRTFFDIPKWSSDPTNGSEAQYCSPRAESWANFLWQLSRLKDRGAAAPKMVRHFLVVDEGFIKDRASEYALSMKERADPAAPLNDIKVLWNPLAHDSYDDLLNTSKIVEQLTKSYVTPRLKDGEPVRPSRPEAMWETARLPLTKPDASPEWGIAIGPEAPGRLKLVDALAEYHEDEGLKVLRVGQGDWKENEPSELLKLLLKKESGQYALVDYFAARNHTGWVFAIQSTYDPDMGVVKMKLLFSRDRDGGKQWTQDKENLDRLFGFSGNADHVETMAAFLAREGGR